MNNKKQILLSTLRMMNFKGEKERTTAFNVDVTTIAGANGLGKSRHADAFTWMLFGKDTEGRADYEVRSIVDGEPLHKVECGVEGVLVVDGEQVKLRRMYNEKWTKPRGQVEQVFQGYQTECFWNDAPVSVTEYKKRVNEIVDEELFKMLTNPKYFVSQKWQTQREQLFTIAGAMTDAEVAEKHPEFAALVSVLEKKPLQDYKAEVGAALKRLRKELSEVQPRIDQVVKDMPEEEDFDDLQKQADALKTQIDDVDAQIADRFKAWQSLADEDAKRADSLREKRAELARIEGDFDAKKRQEAADANKGRVALAGEINDLEAEVSRLKGRVATLEQESETANTQFESLTKQREAKRAEWHEENEKEWEGDTTCPCCGQPLPEDKIADAKQRFADTKAMKLEAINVEGGEMKRLQEVAQARIEEIAGQIADLNKQIEDKQKVIDDKCGQLVNMTEAKPVDAPRSSIPGWSETKAEIDRLEAELRAPKTAVDTTELNSRKQQLQQERDALIARLSKKDIIARLKKSVDDLEQQGKDLAQQIAEQERVQYDIAQFTKTRIEDCEFRINSMFKLVKFKLFGYTIEGNEYECCVPTIKGVPYGSANTAAQINAGLDIINVLSVYYHVSAPIFIDNRESVNEIPLVDAQVINLVVTTDKQLVVK